MNFNKTLMKQAFQQTFANKVALADGEEKGAKFSTALLKAIIEIEENKSIEFDGTVLTFISRRSGEKRIVTEFGCVKDACPCGNQPSYYSAMFAILECYNQLTQAADVTDWRTESQAPYFQAKLYTERPTETIEKIRI